MRLRQTCRGKIYGFGSNEPTHSTASTACRSHRHGNALGPSFLCKVRLRQTRGVRGIVKYARFTNLIAKLLLEAADEEDGSLRRGRTLTS